MGRSLRCRPLAVVIALGSLSTLAMLGATHPSQRAGQAGDTPAHPVRAVVAAVTLYNIAEADGLCLDAMNSGSYGLNGDPIQLWTCNNNPPQLWRLEEVNGGEGVLIINADGQCLDADSNAFPSDGDQIQLWTCNASRPEQVWGYWQDEPGVVQVVNADRTGYCLDSKSQDFNDNGDPIQLWSCATTDEQQWMYQPPF